jgi:hypothetical protein
VTAVFPGVPPEGPEADAPVESRGEVVPIPPLVAAAVSPPTEAVLRAVGEEAATRWQASVEYLYG